MSSHGVHICQPATNLLQATSSHDFFAPASRRCRFQNCHLTLPGASGVQLTGADCTYKCRSIALVFTSFTPS